MMRDEKNLLKFNDYNWDGAEKADYKKKGSCQLFKNVARQNIFLSNERDGFDVRYFECGEGGYTALEKHQHCHVAMVIRGKGKIIIGNNIYDVEKFDVVHIPSWEPHQLINNDNEPFGFICTVKSERDEYQLLSIQELECLKQNSNIKKHVKVSTEYFKDHSIIGAAD